MLKIILITYGLSAIIQHGKIFDRPRCWLGAKSYKLYELLSCMQCLGFWCGLFVSLCFGYGLESVLLGMLTSGTNEIIDIVIQRIEKF